jgi:hypothetical protein
LRRSLSSGGNSMKRILLTGFPERPHQDRRDDI